MPAISSTTLANGTRVDLSTTGFPRDGVYYLLAQLYDRSGALIRTVTVDTAFNSDGSTSPPRSESLTNFSVVGLSRGGFAVGYDDTALNPPAGVSQAEIHRFDAAGNAIGNQFVGTTAPSDLYPNTGNPVLYATASNEVVSVVTGGDRLQHLERTDYQTADRVYDVRPSDIYDGGGNLIVTVPRTQLGNPSPTHTREVLDSHFNLISSTAVNEQVGTSGADSLAGTISSDDLTGGAGDDTLFGAAGYDVLTGGAGADRFLFSTDGSVDKVADFDPAADTLALVDASGNPLHSATGVLTFWRGSGVLTYDPDGDNGPAPAQSIAVLPGVSNLSAANFASGYEPAVLRIYNPIDPAQAGALQGSRADIVYGFGHTNFVQAEADYNPGGVLQTYTVNFTDKTASVTFFDQLNLQPWDHLVADYAANGQLSIYATYFDDGTHVLWRFDAAGDQPWSRIVDHFDAQGRQLTREVVADDGSHWAAIFDVADAKPYGYEVDFFDPNGALTSRSFFNDNGTPFAG
ncbi:MAG: hypothetical protein JF588_20885 [Caulobacterales bacterium]|nr:hypothetical protein [Caulobacterales bacterium]